MSVAATVAELPQVVIYTDGGCEPNPGPGGYAAVLLHPKKRLETSGGYRKTTNNRMEIMAAIRGLELLVRHCRVTIYSDSQYLVNGMMAGWVASWKQKDWWRSNKERAENVDLWERLLVVSADHQVVFTWVKGHAGDKENERCDALSAAAIRRPNLPADEGYENRTEPATRSLLTDAGQPCWKCRTPVLRQHSKKKRNRDYYYEYFLWCPKCGATYEVEAAKRMIKLPPPWF